MKKVSLAVLAALLMIFPVKVAAQEYDTPVVAPEILTVPETTETVQEETPAETKKAKKEKKVKEPKAPKEKKAKGERYYGVANHVGIGASAGLWNGISPEVGIPLGGHIAIRGGYNFMSSVWGYEKTLNLGTITDDDNNTYDLSNIPIKAEISTQYYAMADLYLSKKGNFHITAGIFGGQSLAHVTADLTNVSQIKPEDYATLAISYNGASVSTDENGFVHANLRPNKTLMPYFGIGWGRIVNLQKWLSLSLDLGVIKTTGFGLYVHDYKNDVDSQITSATVEHKDKYDFTNTPFVGAKIGNQEDLLDQASEGKLPLIEDFLPCVKIGINIRLF